VFDYGLDSRGVGVRVPVVVTFSPLHFLRTGSGAHKASYLRVTGGSFLGGKASGAWVKTTSALPYTFMWRSA
jgi:hypothetical protein